MSSGWSVYVIAFVVAQIVGCAWLLLANRKVTIDESGSGEPVVHEFDGITELNNPMPAWWMWFFVVTIVGSLVYLVLYPGMGNFPGSLGWTSRAQWEREVAHADERYGPILRGYHARAISELVSDARAVEMGSRLFAGNCATCHGSDARGGPGYPDLTDDDWLYGGTPERIVETITIGRVGSMPPLGAALGGEEGVARMAQYVLSLSGREHDETMAAAAAPLFTALCASCHGLTGEGNPAVGAPNLTDDVWLHRGKLVDVEYQITNGRVNQMPAHGEILAPEKIHLLALYVYSLSAGR